MTLKKSHYAILLIAIVVAVLSFLAGRRSFTNKSAQNASQRRVLYYVDPMHPAYRSDKPGIAPDCGMQLEAVYGDGSRLSGNGVAAAAMPVGTVNINTTQQQLIGLRLAAAEMSSGIRNVRLLGKIASDDERTYRLTAGADGFIEETFGNPTGTLVKKNERLASFRSLDFLAAEQIYLTALVQAPQFKNEVINESDWRNQTAKLAYGRLRALGIGEAQLKQLATSHAVSDTIDIVSPVDGFVVARSVSPGQRVEKAAEFYRIVDLSRVVIFADVFENEAQYFHPGAVATLSLPDGTRGKQGKTLRATVSKVLPQFDGVTRTMKVRLEAENAGFVLRPEMFVDVELAVAVPTGLSVPAEALLDSGTKKRVFVDRGNGFFEPRQVETGMRVGDQIQILKGLTAGERVVVSGTFLVDSESRLKAPAATASANSDELAKNGDAKLKTVAANNSSKGTQAAKAKDPKCGMDVVPAESVSSGLTLSHNGKTYYFCSKSCKDQFQVNPDKFLVASHTDAMHD